MTRRSLEGAPHQLVEESLNPSRHLRHHELTVRPDAFDPHLDVEFEAEGSAGRSVRCQHRDRRFGGSGTPKRCPERVSSGRWGSRARLLSSERVGHSQFGARISSALKTVQSYNRPNGSRRDSPRGVREYSTPTGEVGSTRRTTIPLRSRRRRVWVKTRWVTPSRRRLISLIGKVRLSEPAE